MGESKHLTLKVWNARIEGEVSGSLGMRTLVAATAADAIEYLDNHVIEDDQEVVSVTADGPIAVILPECLD